MDEISMLISVHIGDIHFGALDAEQLYSELKSEFLNRLKKLPRIDFISINGDLYNHILSLNDSNTYYSFKWWDELKKIAKKKRCKYIRVIKGTKSHDHNQLENLQLDDNIDIKIISKVYSENLNGFKVLYLPEEYIKDPNSYYEEYYKDSYNMILGHGQFEETSFMNYDSEITMDAVPTFNSTLLQDICDGPIIFGHIHNAVRIKKRIFYTGSFSRWKMGEEEPKGFLINIQDLYDTSKFRIIPCINNKARKYVTYNISDLIQENTTERAIEKINNYIIKNNIYKIRLKASDNNNSLYMAKLSAIHNYYMNNKLVILDIKTQQLSSDDEEEDNELVDKYSYLFDNIPNEDKLSKFIKDRFDYNLSSERINELLTSDILKLLEKTL